ncbi:DUF3450 domain-containing protein [Rheinheimera sp.]|uniref:DUF3450 domain-containing protein n=1 Tax=Rheinheimera sp. TaxID=1869214 RepID=UPI002B47DF56|nr:DUF3450 domain-containing protein [Rheinheimera sp.]HJS15842.1 DUF3450 domain-containing protein [Rheinheimera sp.]
MLQKIAFQKQVTLISNYWLGTMSNNNIRKSLVASALFGAFALASTSVAADPLVELHKAGQQNIRAAVQSQEKINNIFDQSQELLAEYRQLVEQTENLKVYNDHVAKLVADQNTQLASFDKQIGTIEGTKQGIVPLMYRMVDTLEAFIKADMPIDLTNRLARIDRLRAVLGNSAVNTSEMYRLVIEAYQIEKDLGTALVTYTDKLTVDGGEITVNYVYVGRVALLAQSLDEKQAWMFNRTTGQWEALGQEYLESTKFAIRVAGKQAAPELLKLPVIAAE